MLDFNNTEIAFAGRTNKDLNKAYWLFRLISNNLLVKAGQSLTPVALKLGLPIKGIIKATIFKQFVGGETISDCLPVIKDLSDRNVGTILDYSVEGKETEDAFDLTTTELLRTINTAGQSDDIPFAVFKVTGLARFGLLEKVSAQDKLTEKEKREWEHVQDRVEKLCRAALEKQVPILIDAEESWIQNAIDSLAKEMMVKYNLQKPIIYNTVQMYRSDRLEFLKASVEEGKRNGYWVGQKIVRGAYMEKERERAREKNYPSPIQPDKESTDRDYDAALSFCLDNLESMGICAGTHNEKSSRKLTEMIEARGIPKNHPRIWFSQLLGMSDHISFNLAATGYNVAKYVPYGPVEEVLPYLIRRANENTSVAGQTGRELNLIQKEKERRRSASV